MKAVEATLENVTRAAAILNQGGLVVMPTETVYGVAADATNPKAVERLYQVKGRPKENPLIVHIGCLDTLEEVAIDLPNDARVLAERFWPGPLTMVLRKAPQIIDRVTAGLPTVAVRFPRHPVAVSLITLAGTPLAVPSANPFMRLSPTRVDHLDPNLLDQVDMVLDGGPCTVGIESTVFDLTQEPPRILRPGGVTRGDIQAALGRPLGAKPPAQRAGARPSPGMYERHYAPKAPLFIVPMAPPDGYALVFGPPKGAHQVKMPRDPIAYGAALYDALHFLDSRKPDAIYVEAPPRTRRWEAVRDRLGKAAQA